MAAILNKSAAILDFQVAHRADLTSSPQRTFVPNLVLVSQFARLVPLSALLLLKLHWQWAMRQIHLEAIMSNIFNEHLQYNQHVWAISYIKWAVYYYDCILIPDISMRLVLSIWMWSRYRENRETPSQTEKDTNQQSTAASSVIQDHA